MITTDFTRRKEGRRGTVEQETDITSATDGSVFNVRGIHQNPRNHPTFNAAWTDFLIRRQKNQERPAFSKISLFHRLKTITKNTIR